MFLIEQSLLDQPILYLSRYVVQNKKEYYQLLLDVTKKNAWEAWICFMLDAVKVTADWTIDKTNAIVSLQEATAQHIKDNVSKIYAYELLQLLFEKPYLRTKDLLDREIYRSRQAAMTNLKQLEALGILEVKMSGKEMLFINTRLLDLMRFDSNDFACFRT